MLEVTVIGAEAKESKFHFRSRPLPVDAVQSMSCPKAHGVRRHEASHRGGAHE